MTPTRIVKCDTHNFAVQVLVAVDETVKGDDGKRVKTGAQREEWQDKGYYGHRLDWAAESALHQAVPVGEVVTKSVVDAAVAEIVKQTKEANS